MVSTLLAAIRCRRRLPMAPATNHTVANCTRLDRHLNWSAYLTYEAKTAKVGNLQAELEKTTEIYDKDNKKAGSLYSQKGTYVHLSSISKNLQNAVISTEDRNFYKETWFLSQRNRAGVCPARYQ
jgi:membrane peptidoglycan carboxypeptidase